MVSRANPEPPRRQRKPEQRPEQILDAALLVFRRQGFGAARMEDVATQAGISKGTIYLYFDSKTTLLEALIERAMAPVAARLQAMASAAPEGPVEPVLRAMLGFAAARLQDPDAAAVPLLVIGEAGRFAALARHYRERVIEVGLGAVTALIERAVRSGEFGPLDAALAARSLVAPVLLQAVWNGVFARPEDDPTDPQALVDQHLALFLHGARARTE